MTNQGIFIIDVGGTAVKYGTVVSEQAEPILKDNGSVPLNCSSREEFLGLLKGLYEEHGNGAPGIGLSVPGIVDAEREVNLSSGAMCRFLGIGCPTSSILSEICGGVPVHMINDGKAAALAEGRFGVLKDCRLGAVVIIGNGIGGGLIMDGKVLNGAHWAAGEISRVFAEIHKPGEEGLWYKCGSCHTLCRRAAGQDESDEKATELSGQEVFRLVREGNKQAKDALDSYARDMAAMLQSVQMFYDPELIAIGGGLSWDSLLIESIREQNEIIYKEASGDGFPKPKIEACRYSGSANLIGAYVNFMDKESK